MSSTHSHRGVWILAEQSAGKILRVSFELLQRGRGLADQLEVPLTAVLLGDDVTDASLQELIARGADRVLYMEAAELAHFLVEPYSACLMALIEEHCPEIIIAGATSTGRTLMPYVAIKTHSGLTADCTELAIESETRNLLQTRPAIGGNIMATIKTPAHRPQMATVRPRSSRPLEADASRTGEVIRLVAPAELLSSRVRRCGFVPAPEEQGIQEAEVVVTAGRGIRKAENLGLIDELAENLDAAVGATRDVVDRGWLPYPQQVGLSGKTVTPELYVAVGVSGAIQHLAGMQTAENIIAINSDPDAQIFRVAELGIVGDLTEILPELSKKIKQAKM